MAKKSEPNSFFERCYEVVSRIPYGKVTSYGAIARCLGVVRSARMVGWAMNNSHHRRIPSHRVVNRVGLLTGKHHFDGINLMNQLLENEGHRFEGDQIVNFKDVFWTPSDV